MCNKVGKQSIHVSYAYRRAEQKTNIANRNSVQLEKVGGKLTIGEKNIIHQPLLEREKIIFPPLHIKLGLMKQFVKTLNVEGDCFHVICTTFPGLSCDKLKPSVFDGTQIKKLIKCKHFSSSMTEVEKRAWNTFVVIVKNFREYKGCKL